ncbi:hypothetical protein LPW11_20235 [Geomonas sp. RF6]|uniref:hypothetical protein n=1 Tax=Geomonas sp. RF6 TaxID=2897342 RepID=UPI001E2FB20A|nr:hypothetical protein [Geomonas sp. RF6]UFS70190.1 hypothetical protein LPW11_20235 [Geomonas sp. RF6]
MAPAKPAQEMREKGPTAQARPPDPVFPAPKKGELELQISGKEIAANGLTVQVLFRPYPKARHKKGQTAAEAKKVQTLSPTCLRIGVNTIQAVIENAPDGIYEFRSAQMSSQAEVSCVTTIHGSSSAPIVKKLGTRKLGSNGYIFKVLMPEGILWDDDNSFSGSLEDSESITKFRTETGLVWKEYK